jgi:DNA-binding response OmpR family regulator
MVTIRTIVLPRRPEPARESADEFCPHCGGPLRQARMFEHPCFDDVEHDILVHEPGRAEPVRRHLSPQLWRILSGFRSAFGRKVSRAYLVAHAQFRRGEEADPKTLDVRLTHLRAKLVGSPFEIAGVWGEGWKLVYRDEKPRSEASAGL